MAKLVFSQYLTICGILFISTLINVSAEDVVYQYQDKNGNLVVSNNTLNKNAKKMQLPALNVYALPMSLSDAWARGYTRPPIENHANDTVPNMTVTNNGNTFINNNELGRQQVLNEELKKEELMLNDSEELLRQGKDIKYTSEIKDDNAYQERIKVLQDSINEHEKNIELLKTQLSK